LDQRLSVVPRWVILPTIQKQSVAEHCFNVERIATRIALEWFEFGDEIGAKMGAISQWALHHDDDEALTGDIPSTAKGYITIDPKLAETNGITTLAKKAYHTNDPEVKHIVKLADLMESYWFLAREFQMGNKYIEVHRHEVFGRVQDYAHEHFDDKIAEHARQWMIRVRTEVSQRYD
jgi:5'-deoxynucleotidase YfbR-like HD superfamily hydrolase